MIRHIVMWGLKGDGTEGSPEQSAREMKRQLEQLPGRIPEILELKVGIADPDSESNVDIVLETSFDDWAALERYQEHPAHQEVAEYVKKVRVSRHVIDYVS
ncbi:hypothetical protein BOW53_12580 [Solemya pervernicosa gill symbiont]|uniref:Stress-response A/B barrel domain-containing protein n=2 Tax=Gammaproteobacteria incertae sedis TaxID=118884 RepID=A0A1T2L2A8_9GAMM|nr:Dabb family protein [Candidatus Reidiella endopervernicosa]OOZ39212.1 hypothetical protein BOW53_12580 [Solemya pervernicosa gill symbiont]QKQ28059.1 Dabb family protein [Candidatus Reidiella endopervernicosa]